MLPTVPYISTNVLSVYTTVRLIRQVHCCLRTCKCKKIWRITGSVTYDKKLRRHGSDCSARGEYQKYNRTLNHMRRAALHDALRGE